MDTYQSRPVVLSLKLPIFLNKFMSGLPSPMTADTFFQKWNQLGGPPRETQQILKAKEPVNADAMKSKVRLLSGPTDERSLSVGVLPHSYRQLMPIALVRADLAVQASNLARH